MRRSGRLFGPVADRAFSALSAAATSHSGTFGMDLMARAAPATPVESSKDQLTFTFKLDDSLTNSFKALHGGAYAALADVFTTSHLWGLEPEVSHVSMDFTIQYYAPATDASISCTTTVEKFGKSVAFTKFSFHSADGKKTFAEGSHTKAVIRKKKA